ncbi:MAG TPA: 6-phosphogluconolactonase [Chlorobaculum sp.]|nr:6-phosphogluconolactonase [Chlorobaculum sp.]
MSSWISGNEKELAERAAAFITATAYRAVAERGRFTLVLSGGNTPKRLYEQLAGGVHQKLFEKFGYDVPSGVRRSVQDHEALTLPWPSTVLFQGDERYLPKSHPDSNYGMVKNTLMRLAPIRRENFIAMPVESGDPEADALRYEEEIRTFFRKGTTGSPAGFPSFDLVMLGLGDDGHTASLFPEDKKALEERERWVVAVAAPRAVPSCARLTLTLPVINHARNVIFLVPSARYGLARSISEGLRPELPAGLVRPVNDQTIWFVADRSPESLQP